MLNLRNFHTSSFNKSNSNTKIYNKSIFAINNFFASINKKISFLISIFVPNYKQI